MTLTRGNDMAYDNCENTPFDLDHDGHIVKLKEYEKLIPSIDTFYICSDRFGKLYINGEVTDEVDKYIKEMTYQSDLNDLNNKAAKEYNELFESDEEFGYWISNIRRALSD